MSEPASAETAKVLIPREIEIDLTLPMFTGEEFKGLALPESRREPFLVDLTDYSCECREWVILRSGFPENDVRRACKHIAGVITEEPFSDSLTGLAKVWCVDSIESDEGIPVFDEIKAYEVSGVDVLLLRANDKNWIDVLGFPGYVRRERPYSLYGYDLTSSEWSYGQAPEGGEQIEALIKDNFMPVPGLQTAPNTPVQLDSSAHTEAPDRSKSSSSRIFWIATLLAVIVAAIILFLLFRQ